MVSLPHLDGAEITLVIYPSARHAFDVEWFQPAREVRGHWFEYNRSASDDAQERVRSFLGKTLDRASLDQVSHH